MIRLCLLNREYIRVSGKKESKRKENVLISFWLRVRLRSDSMSALLICDSDLISHGIGFFLFLEMLENS